MSRFPGRIWWLAGFLAILLQSTPADAARIGNRNSNITVEPVGAVNLIDGRLAVKRPGRATWYGGYNQMPLYVGDSVATDTTSRAILQFRVGGRLGLDKRTKIQIVGTPKSRRVEAPDAMRWVKVSRGTVWSKFDKQHEPFSFRTKRSVVKVRGTEFVIEEDQGSAVEVLEGQVAYVAVPDVGETEEAVAAQDKETTGKETTSSEQTANAGTKVSFDASRVPTVKNYETGKLRTELEQSHPGLRDGVLKQVLGVAARYIPYGGLVSAIEKDPNKVAQDMIGGQLRKTRAGGILNDVAKIFNSGPKTKKPDFPGELSPNQAQANPSNLTFSWKDYNKRPEFLVLVSSDEQFTTYAWTGTTQETSLRYPSDAIPLQAGQQYFWRVIGLDRDHKPKGPASQSWFVVPMAYQPPSQNVELVSAIEETEEPVSEVVPENKPHKPGKGRPGKGNKHGQGHARKNGAGNANRANAPAAGAPSRPGRASGEARANERKTEPLALDPQMLKKGRRFALLIGVGKYDNPEINPLRFPPSDVEALRAVLVDRKHGGYPKENVRVLVTGGKDAPTCDNIGKGLNWLNAMAAKPEDMILVYFSGHGYSDKNGAYLITSESDPQSLLTTAINVSIFNKLIDAIPARKKVVILDACHSGGVSKRARGGDRMSPELLAAMHEEAEGEIRLLSCKENEVSYESDAQDMKQGVFSYYLVKALKGEAANKDGIVTFNALELYVKQHVHDWAAKHGSHQTPTAEKRVTGLIIMAGGK